MAVDNIVYDITYYQGVHPGGKDILQEYLGRDASQIFHKYHNWVNPKFLLRNWIVGHLSN